MPRPNRLRPLVVLLTAIAALALPVGAVVAKGGGTLKISTAQNAKLGKRVLVTSKGLTLYTLSAETHGRFICTGSCTSTWPPLTLKAGAKPTGVAHLGTIKRADGRRQVTYNGRPLYRFASDTKKGDAGGEGFVDVGTWHAAAAPKK